MVLWSFNINATHLMDRLNVHVNVALQYSIFTKVSDTMMVVMKACTVSHICKHGICKISIEVQSYNVKSILLFCTRYA